jgi:hypothetical protein
MKNFLDRPAQEYATIIAAFFLLCIAVHWDDEQSSEIRVAWLVHQ